MVPLICPVDRVLMTPRFMYGVEIDICPKCGAIWLDDGELAKLNTASFDSLRKVDQAAVPPFTPLEPRENRVLMCPRDGERLLPYQFAYRSGITLDSCGSCNGIFVDSGELSRIADYQAEGGLRQGADPKKVAEVRAKRNGPQDERKMTEQEATMMSSLIGSEMRERHRHDERWGSYWDYRYGVGNAVIGSIIEELIALFARRRY